MRPTNDRRGDAAGGGSDHRQPDHQLARIRRREKYFKFERDGITNEVVEGPGESRLYFMPIPKSKRGCREQLAQFETEWTSDRIEENGLSTRSASESVSGACGGYAGVTPTTRGCSSTGPTQTATTVFFCQIEAAETAIYLVEAAQKHGDAWITQPAPRVADASQSRPVPGRPEDGDRHAARPS